MAVLTRRLTTFLLQLVFSAPGFLTSRQRSAVHTGSGQWGARKNNAYTFYITGKVTWAVLKSYRLDTWLGLALSYTITLKENASRLIAQYNFTHSCVRLFPYVAPPFRKVRVLCLQRPIMWAVPSVRPRSVWTFFCPSFKRLSDS